MEQLDPQAPPTLPSQPIGQMPKPPHLSLRPIYITLILIAGILLGIGGLAAYQEFLAPPAVNSFEECVKANGSQQLLIYPGICETRDGKRFTQPITEEEEQNLVPPTSSEETFTCPQTEWIDCMPGPLEGKVTGIKLECTPEFLSWAKINCPDFQGAAY